MSGPGTDQPTRAVAMHPRGGVAVPAAVGVVVGAVVAALAIVGLVVSLSTDRLPTGPALAPPPPPTPEVSYDSLSRRARFAKVVVSMPGTPYECPNSPGVAPPIMRSGLVCNAPVHAKYNGADDWSATVGFGAVPDELSRPTAAATAQAVFQELRTAAFADQKTTLSKEATDEADLNGRAVAVVSAHVNYTVDGVPSSHDRMVVIVLPLDDGGFALYFSSRPNDTPQATLDTLNASIGSLRYGS